MANKINLNADMGESYGAFKMGDDEGLLKIVRSANIACGFHAGDANVMHQVVVRAKQEGVSIGAHPGFNDLWGFGRRRIDMAPRDAEYAVVYQIGALQAMARYAGLKPTHAKAHGMLYTMAAEDLELALAIGRAIKTVDPDLIYVVLPDSEMERAAERLGLKLAREGFIDRMYNDNGNLVSRKMPGAVIGDPQVAAERAVRMALDGEIVAASGKRLKRRVETLCVHGDEPAAIAVATAARRALETAGVAVVTLPELVNA